MTLVRCPLSIFCSYGTLPETLSLSRSDGRGTEWRGCESRMCSGSEAGSYLRLIDVVYLSTLRLKVIKKKKLRASGTSGSGGA